MHIQDTRLFKHVQSEKCHKSMEIRLWRKDVDMAERCREMEINLDGEERDGRVDNALGLRVRSTGGL